MSTFNWTCPHCQRAVAIISDRVSSGQHTLRTDNVEGQVTLKSLFIVCPNQDCRRFTLTAAISQSQDVGPRTVIGDQLRFWSLVPESQAKIFPSYVPQVILEDYREACLIKDLSPKASATLSRRCLQGMIRDFWKVNPSRLVVEIAAIQTKVDALTWDAIEAVRKLGNIGAHMEHDINLIIEVDPDEANLLIKLIETLISEWYVNSEERKLTMASLVAAATSKKPSAR